jgi:Na+-translocating ferredoxin:NAD+ oxidoreductase subunit D
MNRLIVSPSPHIHGNQSIKSIMYGVIIALIPAMAASIYFFGFESLRIITITVATCVIFEYLIQKFILKGTITITDGSAIITGILLAFNVPSSLPSWMIITGSLIAIGIAKMSFGGLGCNPFNPALIGRVFLLISFPAQMTTWPVTRIVLASQPDAISGATPLGILKEGIKSGHPVSGLMAEIPSKLQLFIGNVGGSLGEISALAIIIGGLFLLYRKIITWHIPFSYLLSVFIFTGIFWIVSPDKYADPVFHLFTGGLMLGAFFMATDMVTSPMSSRGMIIFGAGCGILTSIIRLWGAYPEGVSFAILIMNATTPLINIYFKPRMFGEVKNDKKA